MEYCRTCRQTENDKALEFWQRFKAEIEAMPSVSIVRIEISLYASNCTQDTGLLIWNQGSIGESENSSVNLSTFREKILETKSENVVINYNLNAPNRDLAYVKEILSLVIELLSSDYILKVNSVSYLSGKNRFGTYWTEIKTLASEEIQHSGVRPSPLSHFAALEPVRHTSTGW